LKRKILPLAVWVAAACVVLLLLGSRILMRRAAPPAAEHPSIEITRESDATRVWLESRDGGARRLLTSLGPNESARDVRWSPDGRLAAFESYDEAGHSPMTTTHVWVVDAGSSEVRQVRLPAPNERFSAYLDGWVGNDRLRIRATLLDRPDDVYFLYMHGSGAVQGL